MVEDQAQDGAAHESRLDIDYKHICVAIGSSGIPTEAGGQCEDLGRAVLGQRWERWDGGVQSRDMRCIEMNWGPLHVLATQGDDGV